MTSDRLRTRLTAFMAQKELNAIGLSKRADVKKSFIYDILNGKSANPSVHKLGQVARALDISLEELIGLPAATTVGNNNAHTDNFVTIQPLEKQDMPVLRFQRGWVDATLNIEQGTIRYHTVKNDPMQPVLGMGDITLIDTQQITPSLAGMYVIMLNKHLTIRRLEPISSEKIRLIANNSAYPSMTVKLTDITIMGKIVWHGRKIL